MANALCRLRLTRGPTPNGKHIKRRRPRRAMGVGAFKLLRRLLVAMEKSECDFRNSRWPLENVAQACAILGLVEYFCAQRHGCSSTTARLTHKLSFRDLESKTRLVTLLIGTVTAICRCRAISRGEIEDTKGGAKKA